MISHEPRFWRTRPDTRREPRQMPVVICKARNKVVRACARKPHPKAGTANRIRTSLFLSGVATLRACCGIVGAALAANGLTTGSGLKPLLQSCLWAPLTTSREPRCRPDRWRDEARAEGNGQSLARRATKSRRDLAATRRAVACCTPARVRHACRIQILSSRICLASRATALRRGHAR